MLRYVLLAALTACTLTSPDLGDGLDLNLGFPSTTGGTVGEDERLQFWYGEGCKPELFAVCGFDKGSILAGSTARIDLESNADTEPAVTFAFASSDPSVFEIAETGVDFVRVAAKQPGSATLVVTTSDGLPYDKVPLIVEAATSLAFTDHTPIYLLGSRASLPIVATNAVGAKLFGRGAIQLAAGSLLRHTGYDPEADLVFDGTDHFVLSGTARDSVTVTASLGALTASVPVAIVDTTAITQIEATTTGNLSFHAETATGLVVRGAHCVPSVTAPFPVSWSFERDGIVPFPFSDGDTVQVQPTTSDHHGVVMVSCAIGSIVGSASLAF